MERGEKRGGGTEQEREEKYKVYLMVREKSGKSWEKVCNTGQQR